MATLISSATGNFTDASSWSLVDATSRLDSEAASTASTTSDVFSSSFTPGAITIDGIAIKFASVLVPGNNGTVRVTLRNVTDAVNVKTVTIAKADTSELTSNLGWYFFKFDATVTLIVAKAYAVGIQTSTAGLVTPYRDAPAGNWSRMLRTTTIQAPATTDVLHVIGEHTGIGTGNDITITMNNTTTTSFGVVSATVPALSVNKRGTLSYGTAASTNYYLKVKGFIAVYPGAIFNVGTNGTPIPSTSTAVLEFDPTANVDSGLSVFPLATFNAVGATKTSLITQLTSNRVATNTVIPVGSTSGWVTGDVLAFAPTERVSTQGEIKTILTVDSATQVTLSAGLTNAHNGTGLTAGHVGNLTRNVKIRGLTTVLQGYILIQTTSTVNMQYVEISRMGSATGSKRGIDIQTTTGSCTIQNCSIYDFVVTSSIGILITNAAANNINISNNIIYNTSSGAINLAQATSGTNITISGNLMILVVATNFSALSLSDIGCIVTNNIATGNAGGNGSGIALTETNATIGTFSGNIAYSNGAIGINTATSISGTILNNQTHRNASFGLNLIGTELVVDGHTSFGNTTANIELASASGKLSIINSTIDSGTSLTCPIGLRHTTAVIGELLIDSTTFGLTTTHSTGDITIPTTRTFTQMLLNNVRLNSTNQIVSQSNLVSSSFIGSSKHNQVNGSHRTYKKNGDITIDTVIADTGASQRLTPTTAAEKLESGVVEIPIASGTTMDVYVKVRHSVIGDGAAYNGNFARLILKKNVSAGISADTVIATATSGANGTFQTISGTTPTVTDDAVLTFLVDCDGTTGWVNLDSWTAT